LGFAISAKQRTNGQEILVQRDPIETEGRVGFAAGVGKPVQWLIDVHEAESIIQHGIQMAVDFGEVLVNS